MSSRALKEYVKIRFVGGDYGLYTDKTGEIVPYARCSDCFAWGCADCEDITDENIDLYLATYKECEAVGKASEEMYINADNDADVLFVCRVRKMKPFKYKGHYPVSPCIEPLIDAIETNHPHRAEE